MTSSRPQPSSREYSKFDISPAMVHQQLERIVNSPEFKATAAQQALLRYVVARKLEGRQAEIKGYTIATQVFGRKDNFDQARDPIVSVQANKLRRALERYYLVEGHNDPVCITIPKGAYIPAFTAPDPPGFTNKQFPGPGDDQQPATGSWPAIVIQSFENHSGSSELNYFGIGLATEIALEITRYQEIRVLRQPSVEGLRQTSDSGARFELGGNVKNDSKSLKINVHLTDLKSNIQIWADSYRIESDPARLIEFEEQIATSVVAAISSEDGILIRTLAPEARRVPPSTIKSHQAMMRFYQFLLTYSAETFFDALEALQKACQNEPDCGLIWSMLARLYAVNNSLELFKVDTPLELATEFARKGVKLEPANQRVRAIMAFVLLFRNELPAGMAEAEKALSLNPGSMTCLENIGYLMMLYGNWQRGSALISKAIAQNPYYNTAVHYPLWLDWVRQGKYDRAYAETHHFDRPALFWDPLMLTAVLGLLGRVEEGVKAGKKLLACKPDFPERGRVLIRNYIKFRDIEEKIIEGLGRAGICMNQAAVPGTTGGAQIAPSMESCDFKHIKLHASTTE